MVFHKLIQNIYFRLIHSHEKHENALGIGQFENDRDG